MLYLKISIALIVLFILIKLVQIPRIHKNIKSENLAKYLYVLYFRGDISFNRTKNAYMFVQDVISKKLFIFSKYKERGQYGIYLIIMLNEKSPEVEELLRQELFEFHYEETRKDLGGLAIYIDLKSKINKVHPLLVKMDEQLGLFSNKLLFNIKFLNVSPDPDDIQFYNSDDEDLLRLVKKELRIPTIMGVWCVEKIRIFLFNK